jgi:hypothetical protein
MATADHIDECGRFSEATTDLEQTFIHVLPEWFDPGAGIVIWCEQRQADVDGDSPLETAALCLIRWLPLFGFPEGAS